MEAILGSLPPAPGAAKFSVLYRRLAPIAVTWRLMRNKRLYENPAIAIHARQRGGLLTVGGPHERNGESMRMQMWRWRETIQSTPIGVSRMEHVMIGRCNRYHCRLIECVNLQRQKQKFLELQMFFDFSATVPNEGVASHI